MPFTPTFITPPNLILQKNVSQAASARSKSSSRAQRQEDIKNKYILFSSIAGGIILLGIIFSILSPDIERNNTPINDSGLIAHINNNANLWTAGSIDGFDTLTIRNVLQRTSGVAISPSGMANMQQCNVANDMVGVPVQFDAREKWKTCFQSYDVYDQGNCSASWAITAASTLSNRFCISDADNFEEVRLAPQHLLSCDTGMNKGCFGGDIDTLYYYLEHRGLVSEECFGYVGRGLNSNSTASISSQTHRSGNPKSKMPKCNEKFKCRDSTRFKSATQCVLTEPDQIKGEMLLSGPVIALMYLYDDFLVYRSGIYSPMKTSLPMLNANKEPILHAIKIVGWGVDSDNGVEYWIIENSFGTTWGENGYAYILKSQKQPDRQDNYNPMIERDIVILTHFVIAPTPNNPNLLGSD